MQFLASVEQPSLNFISNGLIKDRKMDKTQLTHLVDMGSPEDILVEVQAILQQISSNFDLRAVNAAFQTTLNLYQGRFPGYRACTTYYHDLHHSLSTSLTMARLMHGAIIEGIGFSESDLSLGVICAMFHDAGFIQEEDDTEGTGAKYTINHVPRSMDFLSRYGPKLGLTPQEIANGRTIILCTDLAVAIPSIDFPSDKVELMGKLLNAADLMAQMAESIYLEKLLFLYHEFVEGKVNGFEGEVDLLRKTVSFYDIVVQRFEPLVDDFDRFLRHHFEARWGVDANPYQQSITQQKNYLVKILNIPDADPRDHLRQHDIVAKVRQKYGNYN